MENHFPNSFNNKHPILSVLIQSVKINSSMSVNIYPMGFIEIIQFNSNNLEIVLFIVESNEALVKLDFLYWSCSM